MQFSKKPCPMCNPSGYWLDEDNQPIKPIRNRWNCEFCGSTGNMKALTQVEDEEETDEGEERKYERSMGR
jgi:hypothetical protein